MPEFYLKIAIDAPLDLLFDYLPIKNSSVEEYAVGQRVIAPFGRSSRIGVVLDITSHSQLDDKKLKPVKTLLDSSAVLSKLDIKLLRWAADYYHHPIGEVFSQALPKQLRKGGDAQIKLIKNYALSAQGNSLQVDKLKRSPRQLALWTFLLQQNKPITSDAFPCFGWAWRAPLNSLIKKGWVVVSECLEQNTHQTIEPSFSTNVAQQSFIQKVIRSANTYQTYLLDGVTGSGKTEVYLQLIQHTLSLGQQALILLPEITLTPQLANRFRQRLVAHMVVFHSGLSDTQRTQAWLKMQNGDADIMLGTRSAVFTSMKNPGLIILDEEHDTSFKQQEGFRYSARDVAVMRARDYKVPIVLGTATPSLESLHNVNASRFMYHALPERAGNASAPSIKLIDCTNQTLDKHLSPPLLKAIGACLEKQEQVILFVNRRGFAPVLMCRSCGWVAQCSRCDARMVLHQKNQRLKCHHCGCEGAKPLACPDCQQTELFPLGLGTQRIEDVLSKAYPNTPLTRIDRDSTQNKDAMQAVIDKVSEGGAQILIGTQMLAKGHHFPNVTLVGIVDIDAGLFSCDFRASERTAQLITQVAGRAGREEKPGHVLIQTHQPNHPLLQTLINDGYAQFARDALTEREHAQLPPFHYQALLRVNAIKESYVNRFLADVGRLIEPMEKNGIELFGPVPAPMLKRSGRFRYQLLIQTADRKTRYQFLKRLLPQLNPLKSSRFVRWSIDIDPVDLY
ncbi:MAG: primosomal protein N' [Cycloclasticus sp. symbiont of Poecilosclerida sp. M]|nr:MAG: primosomal protein N' [Cycloclasticus sp. symbiont of Poecilosclerida sp. M]